MSRCFPYPGYVRTPVPVAEAETTAKLQKERERADKKKEKRSDRKALQQGETSKHSKYSHKKRKHEDIGTGQESKTISKESVDQLEKSGLTEEHGAPCFIQTVRGSPESSEDSSKRRKIVLPSPSQAKNGNILRIKIKREQDSPRGVLEKPMVLEQPSVKQMGFGSSQLSKPNSIQQQNKVDMKPAAVGHQRISVEPQAIQKQASTQSPLRFIRRDAPQMAKVEPKLSVKPPAGRVDQHARVDPPPAKLAQRDLPGPLPAKVLQRVDSQVPSAEIQIKQPPAYPKILQEACTPAICQPENLQPPRVQSLKVEAPVMNQLQRPVASVSKEEPSSSGRKAEAVEGQEAKQSKSDRKKSRKAEKKEKKFRDLFVTWIPPSFEMEDSDVAQDWLFGSTRNSDVSMTSCRASDGSVLFPLMEQQPCLQPRVTFLPDLSIYQLPYVVPF